MSQKVLLTAKEVQIILQRLACQLVENHSERGEISKNILTSDLDKVLFSFRSDSPQSYSNIIKYIAKNHHVIKASDQKVWYLDEQLS